MILSLPSQLYPDLFKGSVLKCRLVCKKIRDEMWNVGSIENPIFFRPISRQFSRSTKRYKLSFVRKFRYARLLIPFEPTSKEGIILLKHCKYRQIGTNQELTISKVQRATRRGCESVYFLIENLMCELTPLPPDDVLEEILDSLLSFLDDGWELSDMIGRLVDQFVCRCLKHCILGRRSVRLISLGLEVLHNFLESEIEFRDEVRTTGVYCDIAKIFSSSDSVNIKMEAASYLFFWLDQKDGQIMKCAAASLVDLTQTDTFETNMAVSKVICKILLANESRGERCRIVVNEAFRSVEAISAISALASDGTDQERITAVTTLCKFIRDYQCHYQNFPDEEHDCRPAMARAILEGEGLDAMAAATGPENDDICDLIVTALAILSYCGVKAVLTKIRRSRVLMHLVGRYARMESRGYHQRLAAAALRKLVLKKKRLRVSIVCFVYN